MFTTEKLLEIKETIEKGKRKLSELRGEKKNQLQQLKKEFGCSSIEEAEVLLEKYSKKINVLNEKIREATAKLQNDFPDLFPD